MRLEAEGWRLEAGGLWLEVGRLEAGGQRLEGGGWRFEAGRWRVVPGSWRPSKAKERFRKTRMRKDWGWVNKKCSTSFPGGNLVDGLPPVSSSLKHPDEKQLLVGDPEMLYEFSWR